MLRRFSRITLKRMIRHMLNIKVWGMDELSVDEEIKILGITSHCYDDKFIFKFFKIVEFASGLIATEKNVLSVASKLYNPLGICSPLFVRVKILLQEACRTKYGWDTPLPEYLNIAWKKWSTGLEKVGYTVIPRCIYHGIYDKIVACNLHSFWRCIIIGILYYDLHSFRNPYHRICQINCFKG